MKGSQDRQVSLTEKRIEGNEGYPRLFEPSQQEIKLKKD
jgi:hypothetical protein